MPREQILIEALCDPGAYPWPVDAVEFVETHISWVFLAGDRVIKLKRPVRYSFVDYSSLAKRHAACLDEIRLNRLLSDDVYLNVLPITRDGDGYRVGGDGEPVEWATLMRRLPADQMLDALLVAGRAPGDLADRLAARLVPFHLERAATCEGHPGAVAAAMTRVVTDNLDELQPFRGEPLGAAQFDLVTRAVHQFIVGHAALLDARVRQGWIREGHGDLRCEHVCLDADGPVQIYDCVEFNRDLRCADIASDLAFLLMDLYRLGALPGVVHALLRRYRDAGAELPIGLLRLYWIHRALVRAKVVCLRLPDVADEERPSLAREATAYLDVATQQALAVRPAMIAMTGLSGTGKSTVAHALATALGADHVVADIVRKALAKATGSAAAAWGEGIYTREWTEATYGRMIALGAEAVRSGRAVVLDGTFLDTALREQAAESARQCGVPFVLVETVCDDEVVERRLLAREARSDSPSDAGVEIYRRQRDRLRESPLGVPEGAIAVTVDTTPDCPASLDPIFQALSDAAIVEAQIRDDGPLVR